MVEVQWEVSTGLQKQKCYRNGATWEQGQGVGRRVPGRALSQRAQHTGPRTRVEPGLPPSVSDLGLPLLLDCQWPELG